MKFDFIKDILSREYLHREKNFYAVAPIDIGIVEASLTCR
jgi:hypothetical protein